MCGMDEGTKVRGLIEIVTQWRERSTGVLDY